jgi:hypothetical protein
VYNCVGVTFATTARRAVTSSPPATTPVARPPVTSMRSTSTPVRTVPP